MLLYVYVVLSKAEKHVRYGELVGTTECVSVQTSCLTNWGHYNPVQLYLFCYSKWQPCRHISFRTLLKFLVFAEDIFLKSLNWTHRCWIHRIVSHLKIQGRIYWKRIIIVRDVMQCQSKRFTKADISEGVICLKWNFKRFLNKTELMIFKEIGKLKNREYWCMHGVRDLR